MKGLLNMLNGKLVRKEKMIFAVERISVKNTRVQRFENLDELSNSLKWKDVNNGAYTILSSTGQVYVLDSTKKYPETVLYGYALVASNVDKSLSEICIGIFNDRNWPNEFESEYIEV